MQRVREKPLEPTVQYCEVSATQLTNPPEYEIFRRSTVVSYPSHIRMVDQVNPGYYRAKREGKLLPVSPMTRNKYVTSLIPAACSGSLHHSTYDWRQSFNFVGIAAGFEEEISRIPAVLPPPVDESISLQEALARAQTDAWDTATFLAELNKTVEMFKTFRGRVLSHYERVRVLADKIATRRNAGKLLFAYVDAFSEAWLTLRYGLRPLYYDAMAIQKAIQRVSDGVQGPLSRGWATGPEQSASSLPRAGVIDGWFIPEVGGGSVGGALRMEWSAIRSVTVQSRAAVGVRVNTRVATMFDMAVTAWEMMPWSFILDWFITVGDAIAAFSPFATGTREFATHSRITTYTDTFTFRPSIRPYGQWEGGVTGSFGSVTRIHEIYDRTVDRDITPTLALNVNLDWAKILDLVTIIYTLKGKILKDLAFRR